MTDLRTLENDSIRAFVQSAADEGYLSGRVLDYGCGKQPYRDIVEAARGKYFGFDRKHFGGNVSGENVGRAPDMRRQYTAILCTQVVQYVTDGPIMGYTGYDEWVSGHHDLMEDLRDLLSAKKGHLILTYPTNWPEVEPEDLHRFTKAGMERLLTEAGFEIVRHEQRGRHIFFAVPGGHYLNHGRGEIALGYGVICRA